MEVFSFHVILMAGSISSECDGVLFCVITAYGQHVILGKPRGFVFKGWLES